MFRRTARRSDERTHEERAAAKQEIARLNDHVARLEQALREVIAASDDVLIDLRASQNGHTPAVSSRTGFAAAWNSFDSSTAAGAGDEFFQRGAIDKRARRWMLTPSS